MNFIQNVAVSCDVTLAEAKGLILEQVKYLQELGDELTMADLDGACYDLGVEPDFVQDLLSLLAYA